MMIWRLRSAKERDQILEELDALMDRKILLQPYLTATAEKHSFWYPPIPLGIIKACVALTSSYLDANA